MVCFSGSFFLRGKKVELGTSSGNFRNESTMAAHLGGEPSPRRSLASFFLSELGGRNMKPSKFQGPELFGDGFLLLGKGLLISCSVHFPCCLQHFGAGRCRFNGICSTFDLSSPWKLQHFDAILFMEHGSLQLGFLLVQGLFRLRVISIWGWFRIYFAWVLWSFGSGLGSI